VSTPDVNLMGKACYEAFLATLTRGGGSGTSWDKLNDTQRAAWIAAAMAAVVEARRQGG
jgi:hypothetical protein